MMKSGKRRGRGENFIMKGCGYVDCGERPYCRETSLMRQGWKELEGKFIFEGLTPTLFHSVPPSSLSPQTPCRAREQEGGSRPSHPESPGTDFTRGTEWNTGMAIKDINPERGEKRPECVIGSQKAKERAREREKFASSLLRRRAGPGVVWGLSCPDKREFMHFSDWPCARDGVYPEVSLCGVAYTLLEREHDALFTTITSTSFAAPVLASQLHKTPGTNSSLLQPGPSCKLFSELGGRNKEDGAVYIRSIKSSSSNSRRRRPELLLLTLSGSCTKTRIKGYTVFEPNNFGVGVPIFSSSTLLSLIPLHLPIFSSKTLLLPAIYFSRSP
ncbi:hypothetical protein O3P69_015277 [Scylla paramamosain]|uniref:Uncharacterized protein n=1 Tax=Scylla paramamosain TaxID=85552 RepID=A0AAW0T4C5_SCYPA